MTDQQCACPTCCCSVDTAIAQVRGAATYCSEACASQHAEGQHCPAAQCNCEQVAKAPRAAVSEDQLDDALEETFPASDPISP
ncbi:metallothionein family protein [Pseudomonas borbori]